MRAQLLGLVEETRGDMSELKEEVARLRVRETVVLATAAEASRETSAAAELWEREERRRSQEPGPGMERLQERCIAALEEYIGGEVIEEIVATLDLKLAQVTGEVTCAAVLDGIVHGQWT